MHIECVVMGGWDRCCLARGFEEGVWLSVTRVRSSFIIGSIGVILSGELV